MASSGALLTSSCVQGRLGVSMFTSRAGVLFTYRLQGSLATSRYETLITSRFKAGGRGVRRRPGLNKFLSVQWRGVGRRLGIDHFLVCHDLGIWLSIPERECLSEHAKGGLLSDNHNLFSL